MHGSESLPYAPVGCWAPKAALYTALRPRLWHAFRNAPVSIYLETDDRSRRLASLAWWSYRRGAHDGRLCIRFASRYAYEVHAPRWRTISNSLWRLVAKRTDISFSDVPVDIGDCVDGTVTSDTFRFAKLPDDPHELLPNAHLLGSRRRLPRAIGWDSKLDSVYFRGSLTGVESWDNPRVVLCLVARHVPGADCKLTGFPDISPEFVDQVRAAGLVAPRDRPPQLNRHRYLVDVDGHSSSWDRYWLTGLFGGVPIRFETKWVEFWHCHATPGEHFIAADRGTLASVIDDLRARPHVAQAVRKAAARLAHDYLRPAAIQAAFEEAWLRRV